jgi:predicted AlkP superfamily phosphohydrolase/phosphomutase
MGIGTSSRKKPSSEKLFVLSLEGISHAFLRRHVDDGLLPNLGRLVSEGDLKEMETVQPPVSLVTWTSYMTGANPGRHGIYGFIDRRPGSYDLFKLNGANVSLPSLWEVLSRAGKRVVVVNVPATYPPRPVNGSLVACFLSPSLDKATYPPALARRLGAINYRIDVERGLEMTDRDAILADVDLALRKRFEAAAALLSQESWDFFQLHVMETDRVNHLLWGDYETADSPYRDAFLSFYRTLDDLVGELMARLPRECDLIALSNHGFCRLRREVNINRFLEERDWLEFARRKPRRLADMAACSKAYSLLPGRIYMNLRGREPAGSVLDRDEYAGFRKGLEADLLGLRDPETGEEVLSEVLRGEEVCSNPAWGDFPVPASDRIPAPFDLLAVPRDGYELKGHLDRPTVFGRSVLSGMHTLRGAFVLVRGAAVKAKKAHILDLFPTVLEMMGVEDAEAVEGVSLLGPERE